MSVAGASQALDAAVRRFLAGAAGAGVSPILTPEVVDGRELPPVADLVPAFVAAQLAAGTAVSTVRRRAALLVRVARQAGHPLALTSEQLAGWLDGLGLSLWVVQQHHRSLRVFYRWAVHEQLLAASPMAADPVRPAPRRRRPPRVRAASRRQQARPEDRELIDTHLRYMAASGLSAGTVRSRRQVLIRLSLDLGDPLAITMDTFSGWLSRPGWSAETRANYYTHLNSFLRWCVDTDRLAVHPLVRMRRPKVPAHLPRPAPLAVYRAVLADGTEPGLTIVLLAALAGLRIAEIARLRREDVTEEYIVVVGGKGGKTALVPTHPRIWAHVKDRPPGPVVRSRQGNPHASMYLTTAFGAYLARLGLPKVTPHRFRHLYATQLLRQTSNLRIVQKLLRHNNISSTAIYTEIVDEERRAAIHRLDLDGDGLVS